MRKGKNKEIEASCLPKRFRHMEFIHKNEGDLEKKKGERST